jgi:hypothetical protein
VYPLDRGQKVSCQAAVLLTRKQFKVFFRPFKFYIAPVLLIIAGFDTISFGFFVALNALTPVWLQLPKKHGGIYGFSVEANAACGKTMCSFYLLSTCRRLPMLT